MTKEKEKNEQVEETRIGDLVGENLQGTELVEKNKFVDMDLYLFGLSNPRSGEFGDYYTLSFKYNKDDPEEKLFNLGGEVSNEKLTKIRTLLDEGKIQLPIKFKVVEKESKKGRVYYDIH